MESSHNTTQRIGHKSKHNGNKLQHNEISTTEWKQATTQRN